jgi:hypothetical protein
MKFDLPGLIVEIDTSNIEAKLFSEKIPLINTKSIGDINDITPVDEILSMLYPYHHIAKILLDSPERREIFCIIIYSFSFVGIK